MINKQKLVKYGIISGIYGIIGEFLLGHILYFLFGRYFWIYPNSILVTTDFCMFPLWILAITPIVYYLRQINLKDENCPQCKKRSVLMDEIDNDFRIVKEFKCEKCKVEYDVVYWIKDKIIKGE